jgi:oxygen-independent coproporphyrinogen-3 oxidase
MMNRLRLHSTFTLDDYQQATGLPSDTIVSTLLQAVQKNLMVHKDGHWQVSLHGQRYLNDLLEMFL